MTMTTTRRFRFSFPYIYEGALPLLDTPMSYLSYTYVFLGVELILDIALRFHITRIPIPDL